MERGEVVRAGAQPDDVVFFRAVPFKQSELRLRPVDAIFAFGVTRHFFVSSLSRRIVLPPSIDHAIQVTDLKHRVIAARVSLPGLVRFEDDFFWLGKDQLPADVAGGFINEMIVHKQLQSTADVNGFRTESEPAC